MPVRLNVETALFDRWGQFIQFIYVRCRPALAAASGVSLPPAPILPSGPPGTEIYNDPCGAGLGWLGLPPTDPSLVTDADVGRVIPAHWYMYLDLAEYRMVRTLVGNFTQTTESGQDRSQDWAKLADRAQTRAVALEAQYQGFLSGYSFRGTSGTIRQGFPITAGYPRFQPGAGRLGGGRRW